VAHTTLPERGEDSRERSPAPAVDARFERGAELLRALSHPARLKIIEVLSGGELCVKGLEEILGIPQPSVSQHLSRLRYAGLIESERRGHLVCYRLAHDRGTKILGILLDGVDGRKR